MCPSLTLGRRVLITQSLGCSLACGPQNPMMTPLLSRELGARALGDAPAHSSLGPLDRGQQHPLGHVAPVPQHGPSHPSWVPG